MIREIGQPNRSDLGYPKRRNTSPVSVPCVSISEVFIVHSLGLLLLCVGSGSTVEPPIFPNSQRNQLAIME